MKIKEDELLLIQEQQKNLSELINNIGVLGKPKTRVTTRDCWG